MATVVVVGLGPAGPELLTGAAKAAIERVPARYLRTARHPSAAAVPDAHSFDEYFLSTSWTLCILASLYLTRCRGRRCLVRTTLASVLGMLLPMTIINLHHPMDPSLTMSLFP